VTCHLTRKNVPEMTYKVWSGTLSLYSLMIKECEKKLLMKIFKNLYKSTTKDNFPQKPFFCTMQSGPCYKSTIEHSLSQYNCFSITKLGGKRHYHTKYTSSSVVLAWQQSWSTTQITADALSTTMVTSHQILITGNSN